MLQKIIIDGYNVIHLVDDYKNKLKVNLETARDALVRDLQNYKANKNVEIVVVFDSSGEVLPPFPPIDQGNIKVIFSKTPRTADHVLMDIIRFEKRKKRLTVVTNDREIMAFAQTSGSHCISPQTLVERLKTPTQELDLQNKFEGDLSPEEIQKWKKIFGIED